MEEKENSSLLGLVENSLTLKRNNSLKESIISQLGEFSTQKRRQIMEVLLHEAQQLEKTYEERDAAMAELEKGVIEKIKTLLSKGERVIREGKEEKEHEEAEEQAEELLNEL